jgi:hypothetical protein
LVKVYDENNVDVTGAGRVTLSPDNKSIIVDGSVAPAYAANKNYRVVIVGAQDLSGNYFAGNKVEYTFKTAKTEDVKPVVTSLEALSPTKIRVTFSEQVIAQAASKLADISIDGGASTTVTLGTNATDVNGDGKTFDITIPSTTGVKKVSLVNFSDAQGNIQDTAFEKFVTFSADTAAPNLVSTTAAGTKLYLTFDEDTVLANGNATVLSPDSLETTKALTAGTNLKNDGTNTKVVVIDLGSTVTKNGSYKVTIPSGIIKDGSNNTKSYVVTVNLTASDTTKPTLLLNASGAVDTNAVVQSATDNNVITVTFSEPVNSTALNVANYKVDGVAAFDSAVFAGNYSTVKLTLKPGAIENTGTHLFTFSNIQDLAGNVMDTVTYTEDLPVKENKAPVITQAKLTASDKIALTFSEPVSGANTEDFEVWVDGSKVSATYAAGVLTLATPLADLNKTIVVKVVTDTSASADAITDAAGNQLAVGTSVTVTK